MNINDFNFEKSVTRVLKHEGGYVNHVDDRGGETNLGITKDTAIANKDLWSTYKWDGNMRTLSVEFAKAVYKRNYWDKVKGDQLHEIHPLLADHMFDLAVNAGSGAAVKQLQAALNSLNRKQVDYKDVAVDGALGMGTLSSLRAYVSKRGQKGLENLIIALVAQQWEFYREITEAREANESFTNGWLERMCDKMRVYVNVLEGN